MQRFLKVTLFLSGTISATAVNAETCSYNEALMAFQQGNTVRGQALLTMAAKDGDQRAIELFTALKAGMKEGIAADAADLIPMAEIARVDE
ncbi:hypothetical protein [Kaarinaea lacus]